MAVFLTNYCFPVSISDEIYLTAVKRSNITLI